MGELTDKTARPVREFDFNSFKARSRRGWMFRWRAELAVSHCRSAGLQNIVAPPD